MIDFKGFNLPELLVSSIEGMGFASPTPIQEKTIPFALQGRDILGSAQTGTGKTGAFLIPLVSKLVTSQNNSALILTPTRELAVQVMETARKLLSRVPGIKAATVIGGEPMYKQIIQLRASPRVIIGTPGRINDHLLRGTLKISNTDFLVLDETDRMLDMGFGIQLDKIFKYLPATRQTLMFSATLPNNIIKISDRYLKNPERISIGSTTSPIDNVSQEIIHTSDLDKYTKLLAKLAQHDGSKIVFVNTKHGVEKLTKLLQKDYRADALHGDLQQSKRKRVMNAFRNKEYDILVATDVASRGIDIKGHDLIVINYDLPPCPEDYIHRIGRTGRNGSKGVSISFVSPKDVRNFNAIRRMMDPSAVISNSNEGRPRGKKKTGYKFAGNKRTFQERRGRAFSGDDNFSASGGKSNDRYNTAASKRRRNEDADNTGAAGNYRASGSSEGNKKRRFGADRNDRNDSNDRYNTAVSKRRRDEDAGNKDNYRVSGGSEGNKRRRFDTDKNDSYNAASKRRRSEDGGSSGNYRASGSSEGNKKRRFGADRNDRNDRSDRNDSYNAASKRRRATLGVRS